MALNCKLDRNITLSQPNESGGTDSCNGQDITMGVGGISSPVLVYNISDVPSLTFEGDNRSDYSLYVETINSIGKFYKVDHTDATYNEEYDNHKWTHSLSLTVANITSLYEDILSDAVNGKYLVCFKPNGAEDYRMFGWKFGATLDYSLNISSDSLGYTITFEDTSEYPLFTVAKDNFGSKDKVYTPLFKPLYDVYYCEQDQEGHHTGYIIAMYVVKVNAAGQPLGSDNKLCQWTGKKQDAYKINTIQSDGGYNIIGTYTKDATFDGKPVKILDYEKCPANVTNSIFINSKKAETISLNSTISGGTFVITSTDDWMMVTDPQYVTITPVEGVNGNTPCVLHHNGVGGCEQIKFMNKVTSEIVTLDVCINLISVGSSYAYKCETSEIVITPTVEGCSSAYTYTISPTPASHSMDESGFIHITHTVGQSAEYTLTLTHSCDSNEKKVVKVYVLCGDDDPIWQLKQSYCEIVENQEHIMEFTGYRIDVYLDINPYSPTFNTTKEEKVLDESCSDAVDEWELVGKFCEIVNGSYTCYLITQYQNINPYSSTYGEIRMDRVYSREDCPEDDPTPNWQIDGTFDPYCEQMWYEPSHTEGNSGRLIVRLRDENTHSPTYGQTMESALTESDWTDLLQSLYGDFPCDAPDTDPIIEEVSFYCELEEVTERIEISGTVEYITTTHMTGYAIITGIDKNVYSPTFLETVTVRQLDERCGGTSPCQCNDLVTKDEPQPCSCNDLITKDEPTPTPTSDFDDLLAEFNSVLSARGKRQITTAATPNTYDYLYNGYTRALQEYTGSSSIFDENYYDEIYDYRGNNTQYRDTAKQAMLSWLMAEQLSELYADSGKTTNTQTELFKKAYELGGGRSVPVYNNNDIHSDVFIARYAASAIYAIQRSDYTFSQMDSLFRSETNTSPIDKTDVSWTSTKQVTEATCDGSYSPSNSIGYALNLNDIFPNASGPYADNFYNGSLICRTVASRTPDPLQPSSQFNSTTKNYTVDEQIDSIVTSHYNLAANDTDLARTVQAVADDDDSMNQMLGGITYYKYNASSPLNSFELGTPTDNMGSFHGTFYSGVIGKDLSSLIHTTAGTETDLCDFFSGVGYIGGHSRQTILDPQYGRRRPGQGEGDALYNGSTVVLTSTPRCLCNSGCNTNLNYLNDGSLERLIGGGTKYDPRHYYADVNGNGQWDSNEPYINDGGGGATNPCAGLHASTYPSGHSAEVWTVGMFLMQMIPNKYKEIYKAAYDFTISRTIVRAHWNSDTMYGKLVATTMVPVINAFRYSHNGQNFRTKYENAKVIVDNAPTEEDYPDYTDGTAGNGIAFVYHNKTGKNICFNGKVNMYVKTKGAADSWDTTMPAFMNKYSSNANGYPHWNVNEHYLAPNESLTIQLNDPLKDYSGNGVTVTDYTVPLSNFADGNHQFVTSDSATWPAGIAAIKFGHAGYSPSTQETHSTNGLIHVKPIKASACDIVRGRTYHLTIDIARTDHEEWNC